MVPFVVLVFLYLSASLPSALSVSSVDNVSCKNAQLPNVNSLKKCIAQADVTCNSVQVQIDAVKPVVTCVYEALKQLNDAADAVVAYADIFYVLVNATKTKYSIALAAQFKYSVGRTDSGTVKLPRCASGNLTVSLPSTLVGKCTSDFGVDCKKSSTSLVTPLVDYVLCLLKNALPSAPQSKIIALLCDLVQRTDVNDLGGPVLQTAVQAILSDLC